MKSYKFWKKGQRVRIRFKDETICVAVGHDGAKDDFNNILIFAVMKEARLPIGVEMPEYIGMKSTDVGGRVIELEFTKPESVQVVIDALEIIKKNCCFVIEKQEKNKVEK